MVKPPFVFIHNFAEKKKMDNQKDIKETILFRAEKVLHYNNLLIAQCNNWLPAEEGNENMMRQIRENEKKKRKKMIRKIFGIKNIL